MKIYTTLFAAILLFTGNVSAQNETEDNDKIYLKNGTIIRGIIVEEIPEKTISVMQTLKNGKDSIYVYKADNVAMVVKAKNIDDKSRRRRRISDLIEGNNSQKVLSESKQMPKQANNNIKMQQNSDIDISKPIKDAIKQTRIEQPNTEMPITIEHDQNFANEGKTGGVGEIFDPFAPLPIKHKKVWNRDIRGFRMFMDQGLGLGIGNKANHTWNSEISAGIQFNPIFYVGIGIGYHMTLNSKEGSVPVFINPRINFLDENITPFLDLRAGWSFLDGKGLFLSPCAGVSFAKGTYAYNIGIGYSFQRAKYKYRPDKNYMKTITVTDNFHGLYFRLTFEFNLYRF
jgi:hypothetical protein